jgi:hypothetical protein
MFDLAHRTAAIRTGLHGIVSLEHLGIPASGMVRNLLNSSQRRPSWPLLVETLDLQRGLSSRGRT